MDTNWSDVPCQTPSTTIYNGHFGSYHTQAEDRDCNADMKHDGATATVSATSHGKAEFQDTDVIEVNGIDQTATQQIENSQSLANTVHQDVTMVHVGTTGTKAGDIAFGAAEDKIGIESRSEDALVAQFQKDSSEGKDTHVVAFSRGALVTERALDKYRSSLYASGKNDKQVAAAMSKISVETFGGAGKSFPDDVAEVHYVDAADPVANMFGKGHPNQLSQNILQRVDGRGDSTSDALFTSSVIHTGTSTLLHLSGDLVTDTMFATREVSPSGDGTIVDIPTRTPSSNHPTYQQALQASEDEPNEMLGANHNFDWYLAHRVPFSQANDHDYGALGRKGDSIANS